MPTHHNPRDYSASSTDPDGEGRMLLVTWYDGLESWQRSRQFPPEARDNFLRRRELTGGTLALATTSSDRLVLI